MLGKLLLAAVLAIVVARLVEDVWEWWRKDER
jgi:hypothetical protein